MLYLNLNGWKVDIKGSVLAVLGADILQQMSTSANTTAIGIIQCEM